jgi:hypothetical protein
LATRILTQGRDDPLEYGLGEDVDVCLPLEPL